MLFPSYTLGVLFYVLITGDVKRVVWRAGSHHGEG